MKFTINHNGTVLEVIPDYHTGGRENGPLGWMRLAGTELATGTALAVGGYTRTAREHSISFTQFDSDWVTDTQIDGQAVEKSAWEKAFLAACDEQA